MTSKRVAWAVIGGVTLSPFLIFCSTAVWFLWAGYAAGPLQSIDVSAPINNSARGAYVDVTAWARPGLQVLIDTAPYTLRGSPVRYGFVPVFAASHSDGESVAVLRVFHDDVAPMMQAASEGRAVHVRGVVHAGVAGYARDPLNHDGASLAANAVTIDVTESPSDDIQFGWTLAAAGVLVQSVVLVVLWWFSRDRPRPAKS